MKKLLMTVVLCVATAALGMNLTACNQVKTELRKVMKVTEKKSTDVMETTQKNLDLKAAEVMDLFIDWKPNTWSDITRRLGLTVYGRGIQRQEDLTMDFFEKNIDYVIHHSVVVDKRYSYQEYNTECFLLVSAPYYLCFSRQPLLSFGDGIIRDFWLDPESKQRVTVVIPLICRN